MKRVGTDESRKREENSSEESRGVKRVGKEICQESRVCQVPSS